MVRTLFFAFLAVVVTGCATPREHAVCSHRIVPVANEHGPDKGRAERIRGLLIKLLITVGTEALSAYVGHQLDRRGTGDLNDRLDAAVLSASLKVLSDFGQEVLNDGK